MLPPHALVPVGVWAASSRPVRRRPRSGARLLSESHFLDTATSNGSETSHCKAWIRRQPGATPPVPPRRCHPAGRFQLLRVT